MNRLRAACMHLANIPTSRRNTPTLFRLADKNRNNQHRGIHGTTRYNATAEVPSLEKDKKSHGLPNMKHIWNTCTAIQNSSSVVDCIHVLPFSAASTNNHTKKKRQQPIRPKYEKQSTWIRTWTKHNVSFHFPIHDSWQRNESVKEHF